MDDLQRFTNALIFSLIPLGAGCSGNQAADVGSEIASSPGTRWDKGAVAVTDSYPPGSEIAEPAAPPEAERST